MEIILLFIIAICEIIRLVYDLVRNFRIKMIPMYQKVNIDSFEDFVEKDGE